MLFIRGGIFKTKQALSVMKEIDLKEYTYDPQTPINIQINGKLLETLIDFFDHRHRENTHFGMGVAYPVSSQLKKDKEGNLQSVDVKWEQYPTASSFFSQGDEPQEFVTMEGALALEILFQLKQIHLDNIDKGIAKKVGTFKTPQDAELKLS